METPESKPPSQNVLHEAAIWYLRSMAKHLSRSERDELASWLRASPENAPAFFLARTVVRRADRRRPSKHSALSLTYYKYVKQRSLYPKVGLLAVALGGVLGWMCLHDARWLKIATVAFACFLMLTVRDAVVGFRVARGYFGSTEWDVRDFIKFITAHRGEIDFTDQNGKRRSSLVPESAQSTTTVSATPDSKRAVSE